MTSIASVKKLLQQAIEWLQQRRWRSRDVLLLALTGLALLAALSWSMRVAFAPARRASQQVSLARYGHPGVQLRVLYPAQINYREDVSEAAALTVYARADSLARQQAFALAFPLPNEALVFVDSRGLPTAGRLRILPGYPDALPYVLMLAPSYAEYRPSLLWSRSVQLTPVLLTEDEAVPVPELAIRIRMESRLDAAARRAAYWFSGWGLALTALAAGIVPLWIAARQSEKQRRLAREQHLSAIYTRLRDEIKVENWPEARVKVEELRLISPAYRDLDKLDTLISTAETGAWRREQLYATGLRAYRDRDWPTAVQAFQTIEEETPYYRDVRFLRRTAALYADLRSRDRSLRVHAATQLGEVADLLDMLPLLQTLGDRSREVADAAEVSFARIGVAAADTLVDGLTADSVAVRDRSYRLLEGLGQSVREPLVDALRSPDPRVTAAIARLLRTLGAREELAQALLWATPEHQMGIVEALVQEEQAACEPLVNALIQAPASREQVLINALAALKLRIDIGRYLETRARSAETDQARQLLQQAARAPAQPFAAPDLTKEAIDALPATDDRELLGKSQSPPQEERPPRSLARRLGWWDRRPR